MAAKLQCDICGGKLIGRPNGIFECDSCGMEYDTAWAKQKVQEITGIVRIEGPVEVQGTVKVEGAANKEALLQRGMMCLEDERWDEAKQFFNQALNFDAQFAEAYLGLAMADNWCKNKKSFQALYTVAEADEIRNSGEINRAKQFCGRELAEWFSYLDKEAQEADKKAEKVKEEYEKELSSAELSLQPIREKTKLLQGVIVEGETHTVAINLDGSINAASQYSLPEYGSSKYGRSAKYEAFLRKWKDIKTVYICYTTDYYLAEDIIGLRENGTICHVSPAEGVQSFDNREIDRWQNVKQVVFIEVHSYPKRGFYVGLKKDGSVITTNFEKYADYDSYFSAYNMADFSKVKDVRSIEASYHSLIVLKEDGTVECLGEYKGVLNWHDIVSIKVSGLRVYGLKSNGSVLTSSVFEVGKNDEKNDNLGAYWNHIVAIDCNNNYIIGVKSDGTVVSSYHSPAPDENQNIKSREIDFSTWKDIVGIYIGKYRVFGIKKDGYVITEKLYEKNNADLSKNKDIIEKWRLFNSFDSLDEERKEKKKQNMEISKKIKEEKRAKNKEIDDRVNLLKRELDTLEEERIGLLNKLFARNRRMKIDERIIEIKNEIRNLNRSRP